MSYYVNSFLHLAQEEVERVLITGCLNHTELGLILPLASISLVTSKATEAFGMVSVEAMSAGICFDSILVIFIKL